MNDVMGPNHDRAAAQNASGQRPTNVACRLKLKNGLRWKQAISRSCRLYRRHVLGGANRFSANCGRTAIRQAMFAFFGRYFRTGRTKTRRIPHTCQTPNRGATMQRRQRRHSLPSCAWTTHAHGRFPHRSPSRIVCQPLQAQRVNDAASSGANNKAGLVVAHQIANVLHITSATTALRMAMYSTTFNGEGVERGARIPLRPSRPHSPDLIGGTSPVMVTFAPSPRLPIISLIAGLEPPTINKWASARHSCGLNVSTSNSIHATGAFPTKPITNLFAKFNFVPQSRRRRNVRRECCRIGAVRYHRDVSAGTRNSCQGNASKGRNHQTWLAAMKIRRSNQRASLGNLSRYSDIRPLEAIGALTSRMDGMRWNRAADTAAVE